MRDLLLTALSLAASIAIAVFPLLFKLSDAATVWVWWLAIAVMLVCIYAIWIHRLIFKKGSGAKDYISVTDAIHYIRDESKWAYLSAQQDENGSTFVLPIAALRFSDAAQEGVITVRGRLNSSGNHVDIPQDYWFTGMVEIEPVIRKQTARASARAEFITKNVPRYTELLVSESAVEKAWPRTSRLFKLFH